MLDAESSAESLFRNELEGCTMNARDVTLGLRLAICSITVLCAVGAQAAAIHDAVGVANLKRVKKLLAAKPGLIYRKSLFGRIPLHYAALNGHTNVVKLLIATELDLIKERLSSKERRKAKSANVNVQDNEGKTPLHLSALKGHKEVVRLLIARGAKVMATTKFGDTPLHCAAGEGHKDVVELLIAKEADVNARDGRNKTPLYLASERGHAKVADLLRKHGAKF